jgi:hypothetical protein
MITEATITKRNPNNNKRFITISCNNKDEYELINVGFKAKIAPVLKNA